MNASDIVKARQCGALYKAYYNPTVFQSSVISTFYPVSSVSTGVGVYTSSFSASCINTVYTYTCEKPVISYQLANDVVCGKYVCGGKVPSVMTWKATSTMGTSANLAANNSTLSTSVNQYAVRPEICPNPIFIQGTNFQSQCDVCNNFGGGVNACCHNCVSGN
jgi:hypothetical protein